MRNRVLLLLDAALLGLAVAIAFIIRFEGWSWLDSRGSDALRFALLGIPLKLLVFVVIGLYGRLWRYASVADMQVLFYASAAGAVIDLSLGLASGLGLMNDRIPIGVLAIDAFLTPLMIGPTRLMLRIMGIRSKAMVHGHQRRALIVGAGAAGGMIAKELLENVQLGISPVGFLDDDERKHGHRLHNVPVVGSLEALPDKVQRLEVDEVIVAMPSAPGRVVREIVKRAAEAGVRTRTVPGLYEILSGAKSVSALRKIEIQDVLRREPVHTNLSEVAGLVTDRTVLVTGAGGSIGSELCRQIAQLGPRRLIAIGRGENSIFELAQELRGDFPHLVLETIIADVRDPRRIRAVLRRRRPYSVFHAAAYKHVPLMERNVGEAILNNVLGTRNIAELSSVCGVEHLVLISTDKAVRPTSIMGATKRIAEAAVHLVATRDSRKYVSVRFGNVLGSRGSVVPTFIRQIAAGGPVTITHAEMRRYFMTIPEAVQLVLQAGALGRGGEVFVLDMGEPVRITDLAADLIRLSGLEVGTDIEIRYTGIRPGEKLTEELFFGRDVAEPTQHSKILRAMDASWEQIGAPDLDEMISAATENAPEFELRRLIRRLVPEFTPTSDGEEAGEADIMPEDAASVGGLESGAEEATISPRRRPSGPAAIRSS